MFPDCFSPEYIIRIIAASLENWRPSILLSLGGEVMKYLSFGSKISLGEMLYRGANLGASLVIVGAAIIGLAMVACVAVLCGPKDFYKTSAWK